MRYQDDRGTVYSKRPARSKHRIKQPILLGRQGCAVYGVDYISDRLDNWSEVACCPPIIATYEY